MQSQPDGPYRFILNYQDHLTKFVQLRPLKSKSAEAIAEALVQIFHIFGAPKILHTDNGREFANKVTIEQGDTVHRPSNILNNKSCFYS